MKYAKIINKIIFSFTNFWLREATQIHDVTYIKPAESSVK